jgi:hypothetical protein
VWSTQEARAILAYYRTGRASAAAASMAQMVTTFTDSWQMDAPLPDFGQKTWKTAPTILTIDAFGVGAAMIRGLFEYLYSADALVMTPHVPDNVTMLAQRFPIRWGPYRLYISTSGVRSSGIAIVTVAGKALPPGAFNTTAVTLQFAAMPPASPAATAAIDSDVSIAADSIDVVISFKDKGAPGLAVVNAGNISRNSARSPMPTDAAVILRASDLTLGAAVTQWISTTPGNVLKFGVVPGAASPTVVVDAEGRRAVAFDGATTALSTSAVLSNSSTTFVVIRDGGSPVMFSSVVHFSSDRGLAVSPVDCAEGYPTGPHQCTPSDARVLAIDWSGSSDAGFHNISSKITVAAVRYDGSTATSSVSGCSEQLSGKAVSAVGAGVSNLIAVGSRCDGLGRNFKGLIYEVRIFNRTLTATEHDAIVASLESAHSVPSVNCTARPLPHLNCTALRTACASSAWPRNCGLSTTEATRLSAFLSRLTTQALNDTLPAAMALAARSYTRNFELRCAGLVDGSLEPLASAVANTDSLADLLSASGNLYSGLTNVLTGRYAKSRDPLAVALVAAWVAAGDHTVAAAHRSHSS